MGVTVSQITSCSKMTIKLQPEGKEKEKGTFSFMPPMFLIVIQNLVRYYPTGKCRSLSQVAIHLARDWDSVAMGKRERGHWGAR